MIKPRYEHIKREYISWALELKLWLSSQFNKTALSHVAVRPLKGAVIDPHKADDFWRQILLIDGDF